MPIVSGVSSVVVPVVNEVSVVVTPVVAESEVKPKVKKDNKKCKYCNRILSDRVSRWKHEKICNQKDENEMKELVKRIRDELKEEIKDELRKEMNEIIRKESVISNNIENMNIVNNINITFKKSDTIEQDIKKEDALQILSEDPRVILVSLLKMLYSNDEYIEYRTAIVKNLDSPTMEVFNFNKKEYVEVKTDNGLTSILNDYSNALYYLSRKFLDDIGKDKDYAIYSNGREVVETYDKIQNEKNKIKKVLYMYHKNAELARKIYEDK